MHTNNEQDPRLQRYTQQLKSVEVSDEECDRVVARLQAVITDYQEAPRQQMPEQMRSHRLAGVLAKLASLVQIRPLRWAGSAAAFLSVAFSFILFGGSSAPAFASVQERLQTISTMQYSSEMRSNGTAFMRMQVYYREPGQLRVETQPLTENSGAASSINVIDVVAGKGIIFFPGQKIAVPFEFDPTKGEATPQDNPLYWLETVRNYKGPVKQLESKLVNNVLANGFVIESSGVITTLWTDVDTDLPVKLRVELPAADSGQAPFVMIADVQFNQPMMDELFSMDVDNRYKRVSPDQE